MSTIHNYDAWKLDSPFEQSPVQARSANTDSDTEGIIDGILEGLPQVRKGGDTVCVVEDGQVSLKINCNVSSLVEVLDEIAKKLVRAGL